MFQKSKFYSLLPVLIVCCTAGCSQTTRQTEYFLFVAEGLPEPVLQDVGRQFQELLGERAQPGDLIHLVSTPTHTPVASVTVPNGGRNTRLRHRGVRDKLPAILALFKSGAGSGSGQVQLTQIASTVGSLRRTASPMRIVIVGSPLYDDPRQPAWAMTEGLVPTDGALISPQSPFYTDVDLPEGTLISWISPTSEWGSAMQRESVVRFYRAYFQEQQGQLVRFTVDPATAFAFDLPQFEGTIALRDEQAGMKRTSIQSRRAEAEPPEEVIVPIEPQAISVPARSPAVPVVPTPIPQSAEELLAAAQANSSIVAVAILWESADPRCDLDMWISKTGIAEELYHQRMTTPFGQLFRDVTSSGSIGPAGSDFRNSEWAQIHTDRLEDITLWVNAFRTLQPAKLKVITVCRGERREQTLQLNISGGDSGADRERRAQSHAWIKIAL